MMIKTGKRRQQNKIYNGKIYLVIINLAHNTFRIEIKFYMTWKAEKKTKIALTNIYKMNCRKLHY